MTYTAEETKKHRKKWIDALTSNFYQQTRWQLTNDDRTAFCCLGVACEISGLGVWGQTYGGSILYYTLKNKDCHINGLPTEVQEYYGLADRHGKFFRRTKENKRKGYSLGNLCGNGATFGEIADIIESEPEGLLA